MPDGSLYQVSDGVYITSPEFSLLLLSKSLPFDALVLLCDEVCGGYALDATERGFYDRPALSSVSKVGANAFKGCTSLKKLTVKSSSLKKAAFKNMAKGSSLKTVKVSGVSKALKKSYAKWASAYGITVK